MCSFHIYPLLAVLLLGQLTNGLEDVESTRTVAVEEEPAQQAEELLLIDNSQGQQANEGPRVTRQFGFGGPGFGFGPQAAYFGGGGFPGGYGGGFPGGYGGGFGGGYGGGFGGRGFQRVRTVTRTRVVNRFGGFGGGYGGGYGGGFYG